jgi:parallel beta-helix repeat protein
MNAHKRIRLVHLLAFTIMLSLYPLAARSQALVVNCDTGGTINGALGSLKPGNTLTVIGACTESVAIEAEVSRITLDGRGTARLQSPAPTQNTIAIRGREITVRGFTISGGNNGVIVQRGGTAVIDDNNVRNNLRSGILLGPGSSASIINNTIENNTWGITVEENSSARVGFQVPTLLGLPNTIQNNTAAGILVERDSSARVIGATIRNNGGDGIQVDQSSRADITDNSIEANVGNGISVSENSEVHLDFGSRVQAVVQANRTAAGTTNGGFGITCLVGAHVSGSLGTLTGARGSLHADSTCINSTLNVSGLSFAPNSVTRGGTFTATFSGANLSAQTYFDVRFRTPGSNTEQEALNWQQGASATVSVPASIQTGTYVVTSVRVHTDVADHSGPYIPVSATLNVLP